MTDHATATETPPEPTDFGDGEFTTALFNVTNVGNLDCSHCFVFRAGDPNAPRDKMNDETMLHQLRVLRDKHKIKSMLFMRKVLGEDAYHHRNRHLG